MNLLLRVLLSGALGALGLALGRAMLAMLAQPAPALRLAAHANEQLGASGVRHPVTAVLLNFRGYDTLLEIAVLLLALLGVLAVSRSAPASGQRARAPPQALLWSMARTLAPLMVLVAAYLLWAGARQPGGAFQAGAVLAAMAVLLYLAGLMPPWNEPGLALRAALAAGFLLFLAVAAALLRHGALLAYPAPLAGALILAIEAGLTLSLGLMLAGLYLWLPDEHEEFDN